MRGGISLHTDRAADYFHIVDGPVVVVRLHMADVLNGHHPRVDPPEDGVLPVQPRRGRKRNEELQYRGGDGGSVGGG